MVHEAVAGVGEQLNRVQIVVDHHGLENVELEISLRAGETDRGVIAHDLTATMVIASHWVGFTLPGMIDEPGSFSGSTISPRPQRGPDASQRMSLAIFISEAASVFSAPRGEDDFVVGEQGWRTCWDASETAGR